MSTKKEGGFVKNRADCAKALKLRNPWKLGSTLGQLFLQSPRCPDARSSVLGLNSTGVVSF